MLKMSDICILLAVFVAFITTAYLQLPGFLLFYPLQYTLKLFRERVKYV
jgi:hypothetical protein